MFEEVFANYALSVAGYTYEGITSIRIDFFDSHLGANANSDVLDGIITDEGLPIKRGDILNWHLTPAN